MLHSIKEPDLYASLMLVVEFQLKLLKLVTDITVITPFTLDVFTNAFGVDAGQWIWSRYTALGKKGQELEIKKSIDALRDYCLSHPTDGAKLVAAVAADIKFPNHLNDQSFELNYPKLDPSLRAAAGNLLLQFYNELGSSGFPQTITGLTDRLTRTAYLRSYCRVNSISKVCPVCDRNEPDSKDGVPAFQLDHYLPKNLYPMLSVHPRNLLPTCGDCNTVFKGKYDPLDNNPLGLSPAALFPNSFHPYDTPIMATATVSVVKTNIGSLQIQIADLSGMPSRRVSRASKVYSIPQRWEKRLKDVVILEVIEELKRHGRVLKTSLSLIDTKEYLNERLTDANTNTGKRGNSLLMARYVDYVLTDQTELNNLHKTCFP